MILFIDGTRASCKQVPDCPRTESIVSGGSVPSSVRIWLTYQRPPWTVYRKYASFRMSVSEDGGRQVKRARREQR